MCGARCDSCTWGIRLGPSRVSSACEAVAELSWVERYRMHCRGLPSSYLMAHGASSVAKDLGEKAGSAEGLSLWLICFVQKNCRGKSLKGWPKGHVLLRDLLNTFLARIDGTFQCSICAWTCC